MPELRGQESWPSLKKETGTILAQKLQPSRSLQTASEVEDGWEHTCWWN